MICCKSNDPILNFEHIAYFTNSNFDNIDNELDTNLHISSKLKEAYPDYSITHQDSNLATDCLTIDNVFSLIIPKNIDVTYTMLAVVLEKLKTQCLDNNINKICISFKGLKLPEPGYILYDTIINYELKTLLLPTPVSNVIEYVFSDTDINIYYLI